MRLTTARSPNRPGAACAVRRLVGSFAVVLVLVLVGSRSADAADACRPIQGVEQVLGSPGVFIGDMHGSAESPAFLSALVCHAAKSDRPIIVALEYEALDQAVVDQFLRTEDEEKALATLTATRYWMDNSDGRASGAMRDALKVLRKLVRAGKPIRLVLYDHGGATFGERDRASADHVRRIREETQGRPTYWIFFGGNVHARKTKGLPFVNAPSGAEEFEPLGYLLRDWGLVHLDAAYRGGSSWSCTGPSRSACGRMDLGPACVADCPVNPQIRLQTTDAAYDGVYDVGSLTMSRPLRWSGKD